MSTPILEFLSRPAASVWPRDTEQMHSPAIAMTPDQLFELTTHYHDLGEHRTGTAVDLETADWFFGRLADLGATSNRRQTMFDRYDVRASLADADGETIPCGAVYYEFLGRFEGTEFAVATAQTRGTGTASAFDDLLSGRGEPLVIAIDDGPPPPGAISPVVTPTRRDL